MNRAHSEAFTLLELMLVVVILGTLIGIAAARYANTLRRANEGALVGDLGAIRSALHIYYGDSEGVYPRDLLVLTASASYLGSVPAASIPPYHPASNAVLDGASADDSGGWLYDNAPGSASFGSVYVNCTHTDTKSRFWTTY
ncbi:MAG: prepilin-type N-terminal cleavage/methylation domain-containing protein [Elusimicrobia bacterium]|nr:prepilin-type N-terminal cleavage/methylation domain-containing protein [Elusimicrobiota bacterium]